MKVWVNGELLDNGDSQVGAFDRGLTVGDGVFETIAVRAGRPLAVTRHLARLVRTRSGPLASIERKRRPSGT